MKRIIFLSSVMLLAFSIGAALTTSSSSASAKKALSLAKKELKKNVSEKNGNNIPRYKGGKGKIAPYSIGGLEWSAAFTSWVAIKSGDKSLKRFSKKHGIKSKSGVKVLSSEALILRWAKSNNRISKKARVGDLVVYLKGGSPVYSGIINNVMLKKQIATSIGGNYMNRVKQLSYPSDAYIIVKIK